jgi:hypothetical protein
MGRPIKKRFFGDLNPGGTGGEGIAAVSVAATGTNYRATATSITFAAPGVPGGVTATGVVTVNNFGISSVTITNAGSGYTTTSSVFTLNATFGSGASLVASLTNIRTNALNVNACLLAKDGGGASSGADIIKQESSHRYLVRNATGVGQCMLMADDTLTAGKMNLIATDVNGSTYWVTKLTARRAILTQRTMSGSYLFATNGVAGWTISAASTGVVSIANV